MSGTPLVLGHQTGNAYDKMSNLFSAHTAEIKTSLSLCLIPSSTSTRVGQPLSEMAKSKQHRSRDYEEKREDSFNNKKFF